MREALDVYIPLGVDGYELCHPINSDDFERINIEVNGVPRLSAWKPIPVEIVRDHAGRQLIASDAPWLGSHALIFERRAVDRLESKLLTYGELLPTKCINADVWIYNPTCLLDALDESAASVLRFDNGRIMMIQRYAFKEEVVGNVDIFKIPSIRVSPTFVSRAFVDRWSVSGLKGLEFKKVWSSSEVIGGIETGA